ncbi:hypothetical protein [Rheinheimera sp.]|uniref:hypothetical protein n=1 Tax=Rheinheimera sp. TaxID=1869214 RepID=UPI00307E6B61
MSETPAQRHFPWILALVWTSPLLFFLWWFYITSPAEQTMDAPAFNAVKLSSMPLDNVSNHMTLLTGQNEPLKQLLHDAKALDVQLEAEQLWVLTTEQLQRYQWPELRLSQSWPVPAGASLLTLWQQKPVLARANQLYQQDEQQQWQPIWQSQGRIDRLQAIGSSLMYQDKLPQADIWLWPATANQPQLKSGSGRAELLPVQNKPGTLAYVSRGAAEDEIWLQPAGQNPYRLLSLPGAITPVQLAWSDDHQWIWLLDQQGLFRLSPQTRQLQLVWPARIAVQQFELLTGQTALLLSGQQLLRLNLTEGTLTPVSAPATVRMQSYQQHIYLQLATKEGLWQWSEHGLEPMPQLTLPADAKDWQLADAQLWFVHNGHMYQQSLTDGTIQSKRPLPAGFDLSWSVGPDGLWYSKVAADLTGIYQLQPIATPRG